MNKEEAVADFLKSLKVTLNAASIYFQSHPAFIRSAEDLKKKIDLLSGFMATIQIGFMPHLVCVDDQRFEKALLYEELADFFHFRKIKCLVMQTGVPKEELVYFLAQVSASPRQIFREGGIENILKKQKLRYIAVEALDYHQLLDAEGQGYRDIWTYMLGDIAQNADSQMTSQFVDTFPQIIAKFRTDDLFGDEELQENLSRFLERLKNSDRGSFYQCAREVLKRIISHKGAPAPNALERAKNFFKDLNSQELAQILLDELSSNEDFNSSNLNLFIMLTKGSQHNEMFSSLTQNASASCLRPQAAKKIKELFLSSDIESMPEVYRLQFQALLKNIASPKARSLSLDRAKLKVHYRFLMLNLLADEKGKARLAIICKKISEEWELITKDKDIGWIKRFLEISKKGDSLYNDIFAPFKKAVLNFIENELLEGEGPAGLADLSGELNESTLKADDYIGKIFKKNKVTPLLLSLFFRFFLQDGVPVFYDRLKKEFSNIGLLKAVIESLKSVHSRPSLETLKYIYSFAPLLMKIEALKAMEEMPLSDTEFLSSVLRSRNIFLMKEAFGLLAADEGACKRAMDELTRIPNIFGLRNSVLKKNIEIIIGEAKRPQVRERLVSLSKKRFFWNKKIRKIAKDALEGLDV
jgi:hypothetical protein